MDNFDLRKYLAEGRLFEEDYSKESLLKALGDADDAFIQLGDGKELLIYNPNSNNDDNANMWGDDSVFAIDKDANEYEIDYRDIAGINISEENNELKMFDKFNFDLYKSIKNNKSTDIRQKREDISDLLKDITKSEVEKLDRDLPDGLQYDLIELFKEGPDSEYEDGDYYEAEYDIGEEMLNYDFAKNPNLSPPGDPGKYLFPLGPLSRIPYLWDSNS